MFRRFADALSRTAALAAGAVVAALSAVRAAFASSTGSSLPPEYSEVLRLAQEKVQAATQPGALGNGVPIISDAGASAMLPWLGIVAAAAAMAAGVCAAWLSMPRTKKESSRCSPVLAAQ
ncbi:hypothetical protein [Nitrososphaera sp.]|uniref:hypothetical protein n=1 Tax=Nitrososphaera sp. TaxID=1971748 RepID=UPI00307E0B12